jgi:hypothetical protein
MRVSDVSNTRRYANDRSFLAASVSSPLSMIFLHYDLGWLYGAWFDEYHYSMSFHSSQGQEEAQVRA